MVVLQEAAAPTSFHFLVIFMLLEGSEATILSRFRSCLALVLGLSHWDLLEPSLRDILDTADWEQPIWDAIAFWLFLYVGIAQSETADNRDQRTLFCTLFTQATH